MVIKHVVMFAFKDDADEENVKAVVEKFDKLAETLDIVINYERGEQNSKEGLDGGFTHIFQLNSTSHFSVSTTSLCVFAVE